MKTVLIVGNSIKYLRNYILSHDMEYVELRDKLKCKHPDKKLKRRVVCDYSTDETIKSALFELRKRYKVDGIICTYESYILAAAKIAKELNLPGIPIETAKACTDKYLMRTLFKNAPIDISPDFCEIETVEEALNFSDEHQFPLIMKPANLAKSLLVTKSNDKKELIANYKKSMSQIDDVYRKYSPNRKPKLIIEEYLDGKVCSVDAFINEDGKPTILDNIVDYQTGYDIGYDDNFHYSRILPSKLPKSTIQKIHHVASLGCKALNMKNSPAHIEIILTNTGPKIVEIGARNGGYRERMHILANGIDITDNAIKVALGKTPTLTPTKNESCAVLELFPKKHGIFQGIKNADKLLDLSSLVKCDIKRNTGEFVGKSSDGYKMCAIIILHNSDAEQFEKDLSFINKSVSVITS